MNDDLHEYLIALRYQLNKRLEEIRQPKELNFSEHSDNHDEVVSMKAKISLINTLLNKFGETRCSCQ